jgi:hypothetical protein
MIMGNEAQGGHRGDSACWLAAALEHEAVLEEKLRIKLDLS